MFSSIYTYIYIHNNNNNSNNNDNSNNNNNKNQSTIPLHFSFLHIWNQTFYTLEKKTHSCTCASPAFLRFFLLTTDDSSCGEESRTCCFWRTNALYPTKGCCEVLGDKSTTEAVGSWGCNLCHVYKGYYRLYYTIY